MKNNKNYKRLTIVSALIVLITISSISFTHSGRTDGSGGHKDNNNASGLGSYHYHHGEGPHLHPNGVCPYRTSSSSSSNTSSSSSSTTTTSKSNFVIITIPEYDVTVNGELIDTLHSQYPVIAYKNITYFPMTSDYLAGIGLDLKFSSLEGLKINVKNEVGALNQSFLGTYNILGSEHNAQLVPFDVEVNGKKIENDNEDYPVLLYKDITYFPMTWRFSVTEFGWTTKWSEESGFGIIVE